MKPITFIRQHVLKLTQRCLADVAGTTQATISRWEAGELTPSTEHMERIRDAASRAGVEWDDRWFFEIPEGVQS
jgi:transcriptional regulator with XRE-family HTH domain